MAALWIFTFLLVGQHLVMHAHAKFGTMDVQCGNYQNNTKAILLYKGDAKAVVGFGLGEGCEFKENALQGTFSLTVSYTGNDGCRFKRPYSNESAFSLYVESRMINDYFESDKDEKYLVECSFMLYKDNVTVDVDVLEKIKRIKYVGEQNGMQAESDFEIFLTVGDNIRVNAPINEGTPVVLNTKMTAKGGEAAYIPLQCHVKSGDGTVSVAILLNGCGTGFPLTEEQGITMNGLNGTSPPFSMFRLSQKKGVAFHCDFVICTSNCNGSTCKGKKRGKRSLMSLQPEVHTGRWKRAVVEIGVTDDVQQLAPSNAHQLSAAPSNTDVVVFTSTKKTPLVLITGLMVTGVFMIAFLIVIVYVTFKKNNQQHVYRL